jgi:hypothetical protein
MLAKAGPDGVCAEVLYRSALPNGRNRVGELRRDRYHIDSAPCEDVHEAGYFRYWLRHGPDRECPTCPWKPAQLRLIAS